jgi:lysophospholipase L1-like esterase
MQSFSFGRLWSRRRVTDRRQLRRRVLFGSVVSLVAGLVLIVPAGAVERELTTSSSSESSSSDVLVAVGDSFTSGVGAAPYTEKSESSGCDRSTSAYPMIVAESLDMTARNVACSGATTTAIVQSFRGEPAQSRRLADADTVVLTLGGNDVKALSSLATGDLETPTELLTTLPEKLTTAYEAIDEAAPDADIFVVTYPNIFPTDQETFDACVSESSDEADSASADESLVDVDDLTAAITALNKVIKTTAVQAGFNIVDVQKVFAGHDFCSDTPWVQAPTSTDGALHPNKAGHAVIAKAVVSCIQKFEAKQEAEEQAATEEEEDVVAEEDEPERIIIKVTKPTSVPTTQPTAAQPVVEPVVEPVAEPVRRPVVTQPAKPQTTEVESEEQPEVLGQESDPEGSGEPVEETDPQPEPDAAQSDTADDSVSDEELAETGVSVLSKIAIGVMLVGVGLSFLWLRLYLRDRDLLN